MLGQTSGNLENLVAQTAEAATTVLRGNGYLSAEAKIINGVGAIVVYDIKGSLYVVSGPRQGEFMLGNGGQVAPGTPLMQQIADELAEETVFQLNADNLKQSPYFYVDPQDWGTFITFSFTDHSFSSKAELDAVIEKINPNVNFYNRLFQYAIGHVRSWNDPLTEAQHCEQRAKLKADYQILSESEHFCPVKKPLDATFWQQFHALPFEAEAGKQWWESQANQLIEAYNIGDYSERPAYQVHALAELVSCISDIDADAAVDEAKLVALTGCQDFFNSAAAKAFLPMLKLSLPSIEKFKQASSLTLPTNPLETPVGDIPGINPYYLDAQNAIHGAAGNVTVIPFFEISSGEKYIIGFDRDNNPDLPGAIQFNVGIGGNAGKPQALFKNTMALTIEENLKQKVNHPEFNAAMCTALENIIPTAALHTDVGADWDMAVLTVAVPVGTSLVKLNQWLNQINKANPKNYKYNAFKADEILAQAKAQEHLAEADKVPAKLTNSQDKSCDVVLFNDVALAELANSPEFMTQYKEAKTIAVAEPGTGHLLAQMKAAPAATVAPEQNEAAPAAAPAADLSMDC